MASINERPLSPHLSIWRWGPHMLVSILHRVTGVGLTIFGLAVLTWWLAAAAEGGEGYETFLGFATAPFGILVLVGLTWAFYQHLLSGIRHLVMDSGSGFDLTTNKRFAILTILGSVVLTALTWAAFLGVFE
jgi:succinate dehydrogenase / fumarate reductase, cytochrome b subunit